MRQRVMAAGAVVVCIVAAAMTLFGDPEAERADGEVTSTSSLVPETVPQTTVSTAQTPPPTNPRAVVPTTLQPTVPVGPVSENEVRAFALRTIDEAWIEFSRTLRPEPFVAAKRAIMQRFPGVSVSMAGIGMQLSGAVSMCFAPDDSRPTGPGMVTEVACG